MIQCQCPHCGASYSLADEQAGRQAKCRCGNTFTIQAAAAGQPAPPTAAPSVPPPPPELPQGGSFYAAAAPATAAAAPGRTLALVALILGLCSILPVVGLFAGIAAVILGVLALAKKTPRRGMAIVGLCCGLVLAAGQVGLGVWYAAQARSLAFRASSGANLNAIGKAVMLYQSMYNDKRPPSLDMLVSQNLIPTKVLVSRVSGRQPPQFDGRRLIGELDYIYMPEVTDSFDSACIVAYERPENYKGEGTNALMVQGNVTWMSQAEFEFRLQRTKREIESRRQVTAPETPYRPRSAKGY
jgi:hypothetical protein